jgi:hypothetical protein
MIRKRYNLARAVFNERETIVDRRNYKYNTCINFSLCLLFVVFIAYLLMHVHT